MIEARHLSKQFGAKTAVDDIVFTVEKGEILGFLGPNGAGKSTTMRMLTGYLPPSAGTAVVGGCDLTEDPIGARRKIGYLPENAPVYPDMAVFDFLNFVAEIRGFTAAERKRKVMDTIEKCFLANVTYQTVSTLSKGFKQRVCFAQSILHDPEHRGISSSKTPPPGPATRLCRRRRRPCAGGCLPADGRRRLFPDIGCTCGRC